MAPNVSMTPSLLANVSRINQTTLSPWSNATNSSSHFASDALNGTELENATSSSLLTTTVSISAIKAEVEEEHQQSLAIFFILFIIILSILVVHMLVKFNLRVLPESLAIVFLGAVIGFVLSLTKQDWTNEEAFSPNAFFLVLLPPIIFESGYTLHKGNFFANVGSILVFAILGTVVSAFIMGGFIYLLGRFGLIYSLDTIESFAFGSMISAVDPVATLAILQTINVDPVLYMLVFGESVLNDAVAIVLYSAITEMNLPSVARLGFLPKLANGLGRFCLMFFASAGIGVAVGLVSALTLKHIDLRRTPSLEFSILLVFAYLPYGLAEGIHLSGIMAILFCGIVMSHYTHFSLSPTTQITMQQTARTLAFIAETCVFAYLGMALFTFRLIWQPAFIVASILLCLASRACNIFPLSYLLNYFRQHKITRKMQFVMWFSGLRGAVSFALSLHMEFANPKTRAVVVTTTLAIVLFTTVFLGGTTLPFLTFIERIFATSKKSNAAATQHRLNRSRSRRRREKVPLVMSKTQKLDHPTLSCLSDDDEAISLEDPLSDHATAQHTGDSHHSERLSGLVRFDNRFLRPYLIRKFTKSEKQEDAGKLNAMLLQWHSHVQQEDDSLSGEEECSLNNNSPENNNAAESSDEFTEFASSTEFQTLISNDEKSDAVNNCRINHHHNSNHSILANLTKADSIL